MQFFKPENWLAVREALIEVGRPDLIGNGRDCLMPANPPKEVIENRRREAKGVHVKWEMGIMADRVGVGSPSH